MKHLADWSDEPAFVLGTLLVLIVLGSLCLNLCGNSWGTPDRWHPDEMDSVAAGLVAQRTLNPHFFPYGGLQYYVFAVTAVMPVGGYNYLFDRKPAPADARALAAWRDRKDTRVRVLARATSALMSTLTVLIAAAIAALLFGATTGLLAGLFLALSPYFVLLAHFATVDAAANFWYWLACLLTLLAWKRGVSPWYPLAAFAVGLACGTKLDRLLAVLPWIAGGLLWPAQPRLSLRRWLGYAALIPLGYVVANPTLLLSPFEFLDGTSQDLIFNALRGNGATSFGQMLSDMATGMSATLFAVVVVALAYLCYEVARGSWRRRFAWLLTAIVPMYLLFASRYAMPWYSAFFFPGLAIMGAQGCVALSRTTPRLIVLITASAVVAAASWALLRSIAVDQTLLHDSRYATAAWIEQHVPHGATIEISQRGPVLPAGLYDVQRDPIPQDYYDEASEWRRNLEASRLHRTVRAILDALEHLSSSWRDAGREPSYRPWFDRVARPHTPAGAVTGMGQDPDYRVVVDYIDATLLRRLQAPGSGYLTAAEFHYRHPLGMDVEFPFLNPTTYVFKRTIN